MSVTHGTIEPYSKRTRSSICMWTTPWRPSTMRKMVGSRSRRHEVDDRHGAGVGDVLGLEHQRVGAVVARAGGRPRGGELPAPVLGPTQQGGERGTRVDPRGAPPVDRPALLDERHRLGVADQGVVLDPSAGMARPPGAGRWSTPRPHPQFRRAGQVGGAVSPRALPPVIAASRRPAGRARSVSRPVAARMATLGVSEPNRMRSACSTSTSRVRPTGSRDTGVRSR